MTDRMLFETDRLRLSGRRIDDHVDAHVGPQASDASAQASDVPPSGPVAPLRAP